MGGYKIIAISGIDGSFTDFANLVEPNLASKDCLKISYDRSLTFLQNIEVMRTLISKIEQPSCLIGWSIGAVAAAYLADIINVKIVVMINPFFTRSEVLRRRNIICDEEVCISTTKLQNVKYVVIAGKRDDKIPYTESIKVSEHLDINKNDFYLIDNAEHCLVSFPLEKISEIINRYVI